MKPELKKRLGQWLRPLAPAVITGAVILGCARAPELSGLPALLQWTAPEESSEQEPEPAPTVRSAPKPSPAPSLAVEPLAQGVGDYADGVYTGSAQGYGGTITVEVTVESGQITSISIVSAPGETASFFSRAMGVIDSILTAQTWEVDAVSGATYSSGGIKAAVQNALTGEKVKTAAPVKVSGNSAALTKVDFTTPENGYADGSYTGSAQGFGGTITVEVTISEGKIAGISVVSAPGETASYFSRARGVLDSILSAQSPNVDTVSGATYSSGGLINAVKNALVQAAGAAPSPEPTPEIDFSQLPNYGYADGVYTGTGQGYGGEITLTITVSGGQITEITLDSAPDETPAYLEKAQAILPLILQAQNGEVDAVSGATFSSEGILEALKNALDQATPAPAPEPSESPSPAPSPSDSPEPSPSPSEGPEVSPSSTPAAVTEATTETYTGSAQVDPDEDEDFDSYTMTLTVTVTVETVTTANPDGTKTVTVTRTAAGVSAAADTNKTNLRYLSRALKSMEAGLLAGGTADAVSGATCSSNGISAAWSRAMNGVPLGTVTETVPNS